MKEPGDRLRELRIKKGYDTTADAARAFGWNENTYKSHENGERGIKLPVARKYAAAYGSSASYILTGDGADKPDPVVKNVTSAPLLGIVAAGYFQSSDFLPDDDTIIPAVIRPGIPPNRQYAVRVDGPSVNRRIADGMYAICVPLEYFPGGATLGSLVHVIMEQDGEFEHTIKEIRYGQNGLILMPVSDDPDFQKPIIVEENEHRLVRINGVVIGAYQPI
jgi:phage repressor protein C with HTH and peptisase S24 domain